MKNKTKLTSANIHMIKRLAKENNKKGESTITRI